MSEAVKPSGKPTGQARVAGVAGWPVAHSLSPLMMMRWIEAAGLDALYAPVAIPPGPAADILTQLASTSLAGLNITLPHKEIAYRIADETSDRARAIGAANLLTFREGRIHADNTDGQGFLAAVKGERLGPDDAVLILGAGGASRAIIHALVEQGVGEVRIANRDRARAEALAADLAPDAIILDWAQRDNALPGARLAVNATSLGLSGKGALAMDWAEADREMIVFDSVYTPLDTDFLLAARAEGHETCDGLDMLIGQARPSFEAFFGAPPPEMDIRSVLEAALDSRRTSA